MYITFRNMFIGFILILLVRCAILISSDNNNVNVRPRLQQDPQINIGKKDSSMVDTVYVSPIK